MGPAAQTKQQWKLLLLGVPLLVLVFASIALTAFLSVDLILLGLREGQAGPLFLGGLLAAMWILMFYKTLRARLSASSV